MTAVTGATAAPVGELTLRTAAATRKGDSHSSWGFRNDAKALAKDRRTPTSAGCSTATHHLGREVLPSLLLW